MLELYKDQLDCAYCSKNMATREVPRDVTLLPGESIIKAGKQLCISCYAGIEHQYEQEIYKSWQEEYRQLERDYKDGKIPYSTLVESKQKYEAEHPGTTTR